MFTANRTNHGGLEEKKYAGHGWKKGNTRRVDESRKNPTSPRGAVRRKETECSPLAASDSVGMALCRDGVDGPLSSMRL
jgi:hypothetical protein